MPDRAPIAAQAPAKPDIDPALPFYDVWQRARDALVALPGYFKSETVITGLNATDIFTLGATLGATIEDQVVSTLNRMRAVWDPDERYPLFRFIRQAQTFPDVLLARRNADTASIEQIAFGIELKGWYVLAKEGEPSFRYLSTAAASAPLDLLVIVPWFLSNVISGSPLVIEPYVEAARYAALHRNFYWQQTRRTTGDKSIALPDGIHPYPRKSDNISDHANSDPGNNFGRIARTGLIDSYVDRVKRELVSGIEARYWLQFFKIFLEHDDADRIAAAFHTLQREVARENLRMEESEFGMAALDAVRKEFGLD